MIKFENNHFKKFDFNDEQIKKYLNSAGKDLNIAKQSYVEEVKFQFAYNALIKLGIALIACYGYRVSSRQGHHIKVIEKISEILKNENVLIYGNQMRKTRNTELYDGGIMITEKQADDYCNFTAGLFKKTHEDFFKNHLKALL
ncbi:MAG: hypothetical protein V1825_03625 [Candidatus Falkowbacteria bacterium]|nr:hypothetical protein [Candidatus Parcubacteria bacterium]